MRKAEIRKLMQKWGRKGGRSKAKSMTPEERSAFMREVANARWAKVRAAKRKSAA